MYLFSDINIVQSNPFNTTIHVSLNVGMGCKVYFGIIILFIIFIIIRVNDCDWIDLCWEMT